MGSRVTRVMGSFLPIFSFAMPFHYRLTTRHRIHRQADTQAKRYKMVLRIIMAARVLPIGIGHRSPSPVTNWTFTQCLFAETSWLIDLSEDISAQPSVCIILSPEKGTAKVREDLITWDSIQNMYMILDVNVMGDVSMYFII